MRPNQSHRKIFAAVAAGVSFVLLVVMAVHAAVQQNASAKTAAVRPLYDPGISPDGNEIAFVSGGDIWTAPATGGDAHLLISNPATESRPVYSPDGKQLAFVSTRTGGGDIYVFSFATGEVRRMTFDDAAEQLNAWSRDGKWLYFSTPSHDIAGQNDIYRISAEGGTPMPVCADRFTNEFFSAPSPDGQTVAINARGNASGQWWRKGHSHLDESEIVLCHPGAPPTYTSFTDGQAKEIWPMWSADGKSLYYVSDRDGAENIWMKPLGGSARAVTHFREGRVLWPAISNDGRTIVFEREFGIWKLNVASGEAARVAIALRGAPAGPVVEHRSLTNGFEEMQLSPDGKKVAFTVHGQIFAAPSKDGGDAARVTNSMGAEDEIAWAPDSRQLVYVSDRDGTPHIFSYDFAARTENRLTNGRDADTQPQFSPDGKQLAFLRGAKQLIVMDVTTKQDRVAATGSLDRPPLGSNRPFVWSPDSKWLAFLPVTDRNFRNVTIVSASGGDAKPVTFLSNVFADDVTWSPDGTYILYNTRQRTEQGQVARVDLVPRAPRFREDQFRDLFKEETPRTIAPSRQTDTTPRQTDTTPPPADTSARQNPPAAAAPPKIVKPVEIAWEDIRRRLSLLPVGVDADSLSISPDGKLLLMTAAAAGQQNLYIYSLDELAREPAVARQLTSTPGFKRDAQFSPDSKEVYYLQQGRIEAVSVDSRQVRPVNITAELDVNFASEKMEVFYQAWSYLHDNFFNPEMNGVDWSAERTKYEPYIAGSATPDEMRRVISLMIGDLNASHSGINPGGAAGGGRGAPGTARLGINFDPAEYERTGHLRVSEIVPLGPAALAKGIKTGDTLQTVDGAAIGPHTNLDELLENKSGKRVELGIASGADGSDKRVVPVQAITRQADLALQYRAWVEQKRAYVEKVSNGRLGYVHMLDMSQTSLDRFYLDLDAANSTREGVVVDIRHNSGGFVNVYAIDVLARRDYLTMTVRGFPSSPARTMLGQRALEKPTILVTDQHSLSDAEDFTEGYRTLGLGKVVGEPTAGWIIYTSNVNLIDGSSLRLPFIRVVGHDGTLMEMHPRPVDIPVTRPVGESYSAHDSQLDAAVQELLRGIGVQPRQ
ncbi:MAG TPA: S41 family peptidase [Candidatus Acidoferrales bacterium]|nr:S41 family peptidase [Candidatus Acidoferrales bacterium]